MSFQNPSELSYFFGRLTKKDCEEILYKSVPSDGKFILRERIREPGSYALAIYNHKTISHFLINKLGEGGGLEIPGQKFLNGIHECMSYLMRSDTKLDNKPINPHPRLIYSGSIMLAEPVGYLFLDSRSLRSAIEAKIQSKCRPIDVHEARGRFNKYYEKLVLKDIHYTQKWFRNRWNREAIEKLFQQSGHKNGKFALRKSFSGQYKLSLSFNSRVYHHKIYHSNDFYYIPNRSGHIDPNESFNFLMQLIDYYGRAKGFIECKLTEPLLAPDEIFRCDTNANYNAIMNHNGFEFRNGALVVTGLLNSSETVQVYRGVYKSKSSKDEKKIALKIITDVFRNERNEKNILDLVDHENIVKLIDIFEFPDNQKNRKFLVLEYAQFGSLDNYLNYLKEVQKEKFNFNNNLRFIRQLLSALLFLSSRHIVHRNIASCNVLVFKPDLVKLCDFSYSKDLEEEEYYRVSSGTMSTLCRRQPPEVLRTAYFSEKSDVWSFGVLMWEIMSYGAEPHRSVKITNNNELRDFADDLFEQRIILGRPLYCTNEKLIFIINLCCEPDRTSRVTFQEIKARLDLVTPS